MFREAGIDARIVLVRTRQNGAITDLPASLAVFDHAIAYVPELDLFIDGTAENSGTRELPEMDQGVTVLVVGPNDARLARTPVLTPDRNRRERTLVARLEPDGAAAVEVEETVTGADAPGYRAQYAAEGTRNDRFERALRTIFPGLVLESQRMTGLDDLEAPIELRYSARVPQLARRDGAEIVAPPSVLDDLVRGLARNPSRRHTLDSRRHPIVRGGAHDPRAARLSRVEPPRRRLRRERLRALAPDLRERGLDREGADGVRAHARPRRPERVRSVPPMGRARGRAPAREAPLRRGGRAMRAVAAMLLVLFSVGCGAHPETGARATIELLRERAADRPNDPDAQRELAFGEMLLVNGDPGRVERQLGRALALAPHDERLLYLTAARAELHGHPSVALERYLDAIDAASRSDLDTAPFVAESAAAGVEDLADVVHGWRATAEPRLAARDADPGHIGAAARHVVGRILADIAYRAGDVDRAAQISSAHGCLATLRAAGPFGPRDLLGFDRRFPPEETDGPLAASYDLGPGRGVRETRDLDARGCAVHLGAGPVVGGGVTYAEGFVDVPRAGRYIVRLETPNSVELFLDGRSVVRLDHRVEPLVRVTFHRIELAAGRHELTVKVATRHPNPILAISVTDDAGRALDAAADAPQLPTGRPDGGGVFETYLRAAVAIARGDTVGAREALRRDTPARGASPAMLQVAAIAALADPLTPADVGRDEARRRLRQAASRDPGAWFPPVQLAKLDAADGRVDPAIDSLERAERRWPDVVGIPLARADLYLARGWDAQADRAVARALEIAPDSCASIRGALASSERRLLADRVSDLTARLVACDARSSAGFSLALRRRDWDAARSELARLARLEPRQSELGILSSELEIARSSGDEAATDRLLERMAQIAPQSELTHIARVDRLLAGGREDDARQLLRESIDREPGALVELRNLRRAIGDEFSLSRFRLDGGEVLRELERSGHTYDQPEVLVLDYTVVRVFPDGSTLELTHNIWKVQSDEAVDDRGEFSPPENAHILTLRTVKADGRHVEPDAIEGKDTISLPSLAVGDYVEYEYVVANEPSNGFPGGYLGDRFYFQNYETPFDRSELTVVLPESMPYTVVPRGPAPALEERVDDGLRILHFGVHESRPLTPEPGTVAPREYIPSVAVGSHATWQDFVESLLDALADQDVRDPAAQRRVARILGDARSAPPLARARRLYRWVLDNVEDSNDVFGLAPAALYDRTGNRARLLHYLLGLAGVPSKLVLARSIAADSFPSDLPDAETYQNLLVMIGEGEGATFLSTVDKGARFGYVPPPLRGQPGLVLAEGAPRVEVPEADADADRRTIDADVHLRENGDATIEVVETFQGAPAVAWREDLEGVPAAVLEQRFEEAYVSRLVAGARLSSLRITGREQAEGPLTFRYAFEVRSLARQRDGRLRVSGLFPTLLAPAYAGLSSRTTTQVVAPGVDVEVTLRIEPPSNGGRPAAARPLDLHGPSGSAFHMETARDGNALRVTRHVNVPVLRVAPGDYPAFARFCRGVDEAEAAELVI